MLDLLQKNSKEIAFLGFGDFGQQVANLFRLDKDSIVIFDDLIFNTTQKDNRKIFPFQDYQNFILDYDWVLGLGYKVLNKKLDILDEMQRFGASFKSFIHSSGFISSFSEIDSGVIIYPNSNIDQYVEIQAGAIVNNSVTISHNSRIGKGTFIAPGVIIAGNVKIGDACFIGVGSIIVNNVSIGSNVTIGAGTVITSDIPSGMSVIGNPMKILENRLKLR